MLQIQVLGRGMIPRGYGIAPRLDPFDADRSLISMILSTPGLKINYFNPETKKFMPLVNSNCKEVLAKYEHYQNKQLTGITSPTIPEIRRTEPVQSKYESPCIVTKEMVGLLDVPGTEEHVEPVIIDKPDVEPEQVDEVVEDHEPTEEIHEEVQEEVVVEQDTEDPEEDVVDHEETESTSADLKPITQDTVDEKKENKHNNLTIKPVNAPNSNRNNGNHNNHKRR